MVAPVTALGRLYVVRLENEKRQREKRSALRIDLAAKGRVIAEEKGFGFSLRKGDFGGGIGRLDRRFAVFDRKGKGNIACDGFDLKCK